MKKTILKDKYNGMTARWEMVTELGKYYPYAILRNGEVESRFSNPCEALREWESIKDGTKVSIRP